MNNTLWLDPLVELIELSAAQTIGRKMNVRMELLKNGFAVDNPKVCELKFISLFKMNFYNSNHYK